jgi:nucleoside-triphosphatase THEP1
MHTILIAGQAGVGKTTLAELIAEKVFELGLNPVLLSFAGPIKEEAKKKGYSKEEFPDKYRKYCQEMGAQMRTLDQNYWVNAMVESIEREEEKERDSMASGKKFWERCVIIDDCRYMNEVILGKEMGSTIIFLSSGSRELEAHEWRDHESELFANDVENNKSEYKDLFTHIFINDKDIDALANKIEKMVPIWCCLSVDSEEKCNCIRCRLRREGKSQEITEAMEHLIDLLDLPPMDEWEDDDEETK